jgi:MFS family permease
MFLAAPGNVVMTVLFTRYFHLSAAQFGILVSLQALFNALQVGVMPVLNRHFTSKRLTLTGGWVHCAAMLALIGALPFLRRDGTHGVFLVLVGFVAVQAAAMSLTVVTWTSWVQEFTPECIRGKYFGRRNGALQVATVVFLIFSGWWLARNGEGSETGLLFGLATLLGGAMLLRINSLRLQGKTHSPVDLAAKAGGGAAVGGSPSEGRSWQWQLRRIMERPQFLRYLCFGAAFGFTGNLMGPFFNVFMLDVLGMSVSQVTTLVVLSCITGAAAMAGWGPFIDRYGNRPVMVFCLIAWMANGYLWTVTTPERLWILYVAWAVAGVFAAGFMQGLFGLLLKIVPPEAKTTAISLNMAVTALPATIAPILAGWLLDAALAQGWDKLAVYQWGSAIHHTLVMSTVLLLLRVAEPKSQPVLQLMGAMRSYRNVVSVLGLTFLSNYLFYRRRRT